MCVSGSQDFPRGPSGAFKISPSLISLFHTHTVSPSSRFSSVPTLSSLSLFLSLSVRCKCVYFTEVMGKTEFYSVFKSFLDCLCLCVSILHAVCVSVCVY